ncbi:hypothetical protein D3C81_2341740 [compost metagenome]
MGYLRGKSGLSEGSGDTETGAEEKDDLIREISGIFPLQKTDAWYEHQETKSQQY